MQTFQKTLMHRSICMELKTISINEAIKRISNIVNYNSEIIEPYKNIYGNYTYLCSNYPDIMDGIGKKLLKSRTLDGTFETKQNKSLKEYSLYSIAKYKYELKIFNEQYVDLHEAIRIMGYTKKLYSGSFLKRFQSLYEKNLLDLIALTHEINNKQKYFVDREQLTTFLETHINFIDAAKSLNVELVTLRQYWLPKYSKEQILFNQTEPQLCYLKKKDWEIFIREKHKTNMFTATHFCKVLDLSPDSLKKVLKEYKITGEKFNFNIESSTYYSEDNLTKLKELQKRLLMEYESSYYSIQEVLELLGIAATTFYNHYRNKIKVVSAPPIIFVSYGRLKLRNTRSTNLYLKSDIDLLKTEKDYQRTYESILYQLQDTPLNIYNKLIEFASIKFESTSIETSKYWFTYVRKKLQSTKASDNTVRKDIYMLFKSTELLTQITKQKEIFNFTTNELLLSIFNKVITKEVRTEMYKFLNSVYDSRVRNQLNIKYENKYPNPYKSNSKVEKEIYTVDEYLKLFDYINDLNLHLDNAINEALIQINDQNQVSNNYDSIWLYTILHLNNTWRHYDVTLLPRISLENTRLSSFEPLEALNWLKTNRLNNAEMTLLVNRCKAIPFVHSKTKKRRYFFCSTDLKEAFTHALVICELRTQILMPLSKVIIELDNPKRIVKTTKMNSFLSNFQSDIMFKSKKMNRTVISMIYSIIKKQTNRNPLEITKYIRSHSSVETTNIYIDIPQEQMDFLTQQLFDLGNFGFIYDTLSQILLGPQEDREGRTEAALSVKNLLGDVYQIENLIGYLYHVANDRNSILDLLNKQTHSDNLDLMNNLKLGQHPAKEEGYQCMFTICQIPQASCSKCPFVVFNFYNLTQISTELTRFLESYEEQFNSTLYEGEKIRLSNILYSYLLIVKQAIDKFGEENLSMFFDGGIPALKSNLSKLPSTKNLVTIPMIK